MSTMTNLARNARPINDDDWGSLRQIAAEDKFFEAVGQWLTASQLDDLDAYSLKATTDERIDYALELYRKQSGK